MVRLLFTIVLIVIPVGLFGAESPLETVRPFLKQHCYQCHGARKQENDKRFDSLGTELSRIETLVAWQGILDQLNLGEMPPEDSPQPDEKETSRVIELLTGQLREAYARQRSTGAQTVARRLNRFELRNTIRDLLYIKDPELRIGNVATEPVDKRRLSIWISPRDLAQLCGIALDHTDIKFEIFYGTSDNARGWYDNSNAASFGYKPRDRSEDYAEAVLAKEPPAAADDPDEIYQGGAFVSTEQGGGRPRSEVV